MAKIKTALSAVAKSLGLQQALLSRAQRRYKANRKRAFKAHAQQLAAQKRADRYRGESQKAFRYGAGENQSKGVRLLRKARAEDARVRRCKKTAYKNHLRAEHYLGSIKRKQQVINKLETTQAGLEKTLESMAPHVGHDGRVAGAKSKGEGFIWVNHYIASKCASGERPNFYSMTGAGFNVVHALLKKAQKAIGQLFGERSDCSLYGTEACWAAKLPDPNGTDFTGGFTGTGLGQHNGWKIVSEAAMRAKGWGIVIYLRFPGDTVGHHWENYVGEGGIETIGHGDAEVNPGVINLFGDGLFACLILED